MANLREQLERMSVLIPDTGDYRTVERLRPRDLAITSSFVTAAAQLPEHAATVDEALRWAQRVSGVRPPRDHVVRLAIDWLTVNMALRALNIIPGRASFEVDVRLAADTRLVVEKVRWLMNHLDQSGASRARMLARIPGTWEGIRAAEILEKEGIHTHITLVFGMHQVVAAADARATSIGPLVGRIVDWHRKQSGIELYAPAEDPGVSLVKRMYNYLKFHGYGTEVVAGSFRNVEEVMELAGCDKLVVAPNFLAGLSITEAPLVRRLDPGAVRGMNIPRLAADEVSFRQAHAADPMSREKLSEGIHGFGRAQLALEQLIGERLDMITDGKRLNLAKEIFQIFDLDGDGLITREEWGGSVAVFDALDVDGDGRITADEVAAGLGAAFRLSEQMRGVGPQR
jgi:transaldolase